MYASGVPLPTLLLFDVAILVSIVAVNGRQARAQSADAGLVRREQDKLHALTQEVFLDRLESVCIEGDVGYSFARGQVLVGDVCNYGPAQPFTRVPSLSGPSVDLSAVRSVMEGYSLIESHASAELEATSDAYKRTCDLIFNGNVDSLRFEGMKRGSVICIISGRSIDDDVEDVSLMASNIKSWFTNVDKKMQVPYFLVTWGGFMLRSSNIQHCTDWLCEHSPGFVDAQYLQTASSNLLSWYATGATSNHPKLIPIPLGGDEQLAAVDIHGLQRTAKTKFLHAVFCTSNDRHLARKRALDAALQLAGFHRDDGCGASRVGELTDPGNVTEVGEVRYLQEMAEYSFVMSPPGSNFDTHRTWQALQLGSIPIVLRTDSFPAQEVLWKNLPVIQVDDYAEVSLPFLVKQLQVVKEKQGPFQFEKAWPGYWANAIRTAAAAVSNS